jgi:hypothetical protein
MPCRVRLPLRAAEGGHRSFFGEPISLAWNRSANHPGKYCYSDMSGRGRILARTEFLFRISNIESGSIDPPFPVPYPGAA